MFSSYLALSPSSFSSATAIWNTEFWQLRNRAAQHCEDLTPTANWEMPAEAELSRFLPKAVASICQGRWSDCHAVHAALSHSKTRGSIRRLFQVPRVRNTVQKLTLLLPLL